jgi:hypothetical protein
MLGQVEFLIFILDYIPKHLSSWRENESWREKRDSLSILLHEVVTKIGKHWLYLPQKSSLFKVDINQQQLLIFSCKKEKKSRVFGHICRQIIFSPPLIASFILQLGGKKISKEMRRFLTPPFEMQKWNAAKK